MLRMLVNSSVISYAGVFLALVMNVLIARNLGVENFGHFTYIISCANVMFFLSTSGFYQYTVREVARGINSIDAQNVVRIIIVIIFLITMVWLCYKLIIDKILITDFLLILLYFGRTLTYMLSAVFIGLSKPVIGNIITSLIMPIICIIFILMSNFGFVDSNLKDILIITGFGYYLSFILGIIILRKNIIKNLLKNIIKKNKKIKFIKVCKEIYPLYLVSVLAVIGPELITLYIYDEDDPKNTAIFKVALQFSGVISIVLSSANLVIAPKFAKLKDNILRLQKEINYVVRKLFILTMPILITVLLLSSSLIEIVYGQDYKEVSDFLLIMCIGHLINVCTGPVGLIINMINKEYIGIMSTSFSILILLICLTVFFPLYGPIAAAISYAVSLSVSNLVASYILYKSTGIKSWLK